MIALHDISAALAHYTGYANFLRPDNREIVVPVYLRELYNLLPASAGDVPIVLVQPKEDVLPRASELKRHHIIISERTKSEVVFVFRDLKPATAANLVRDHIAYLDLEGEIYLPFLLLKVGRLSRKRTPANPKTETLSSWAQILVTRQLVFGDIAGKSGTDLAKQFQVSNMTISRATRELDSKRLCRLTPGRGPRLSIRFADKRTLWREALSQLSNPIHARVSLQDIPGKLPRILSGTSALAQATLLSEPKRPIFAIKKDKLARSPLAADDLTGPTVDIELWRWEPAYTASKGIVDPVSLYLIFENVNDERIAMARDEYLRQAGLEPLTRGMNQ